MLGTPRSLYPSCLRDILPQKLFLPLYEKGSIKEESRLSVFVLYAAGCRFIKHINA